MNVIFHTIEPHFIPSCFVTCTLCTIEQQGQAFNKWLRSDSQILPSIEGQVFLSRCPWITFVTFCTTQHSSSSFSSSVSSSFSSPPSPLPSSSSISISPHLHLHLPFPPLSSRFPCAGHQCGVAGADAVDGRPPGLPV